MVRERLKLYKDRLKDAPRRCELSEEVVSYWLRGKCEYELETDVPDQRYGDIVAERIVLRRLLGIDGGEKKHVPYVLDAKPFGGEGPKCAELLLADVFAAMAFVPLTPPDSRGRPILARLYCVNGLSKRYFPSPLRADAVSDGNLYSWFLTGLPDEKLDAAIDGRSWLLAAELLKLVVTKRDVATARNLATKYIVTGDVQDGLITKVVMGRKDELALRPAYRDFKWIIPKENDMNNVPKRKIEKPATLEEAYGLIESMQSVATHSMFKAIRRAEIDEVKVQYEKNGADIYARESDTNFMPIQIVEQAIQKEIKKLQDATNPSDDQAAKLVPISGTRLERLQEIRQWFQSKGADCSLMFYLLATAGNRDVITTVSEIYPVNAVDGNGLTAVDWALNFGDLRAMNLLCSCGGSCNPCYWQNQKLKGAIDCLRNLEWDLPSEFRGPSDGTIELVSNAVDAGLSPTINLCWVHFCDDVGREPDSEGEQDRNCTLFALAVRSCIYKIMEACLRNGADPNADLLFWKNESDEDYKERGSPIEIINRQSWFDEAEKERFIKLLTDYGATAV